MSLPDDQKLHSNTRPTQYRSKVDSYSPPAGPNAAFYRINPLYRSALRHIRNGELERALMLLNRLINTYPNVEELQQLQKEVQQRAMRKASTYQSNPLYRSAVRYINQGELEKGLILVNNLLASYPQVPELYALQKELSQRIKVKRSVRQRRRLMVVLMMLLMIFIVVSGVFSRYILNPEPLMQIVAPQIDLKYAPHYLFSIYGVDKPVGVGLSPQGDRIYVTEMGGSRLVKIFDRAGEQVNSLEFPFTSVGERAPVYVSADNSGNVFITDRKQHAVYIYSKEGEYLDTLLGPDLTLSEYVNSHTEAGQVTAPYAYNLIQNKVFYKAQDGTDADQVLPYVSDWAPLGVRIGQDNSILLTDVEKDQNAVVVIPLTGETVQGAWTEFDPTAVRYGASGVDNAEFLYPNSAVQDSQGRIYVSDGNNGRISVWGDQSSFLFNFGGGTGEARLSLPRGLFIDQSDRLYVVDAVGQNVKVYDVSGAEPQFLYVFGDFGVGDGLFNFPNDIAVDTSGRLYVVDRENDRVQVWSY
jgi:DNA-binding beta-propeller fold protein YncE